MTPVIILSYMLQK